MFRSLEQAGAITWMNLKNLRERLSSSIVSVVGIAGVVATLVAVLSIGEGLRATLELSGSDDIAVVLRSGSTDEMSSFFDQDSVRVIMDAPGIVRGASGPIASTELYTVVDVPMKSTGTPANVPFRGVSAQAAQVRKHFNIVEGRNFQPGTYELIVGRGASMQFTGLQVGRSIKLGSTDWQVVGLFEDKGSVAESELWTDISVLQGVYKRGNSYQSVRAKLTDVSALRTLKDALSADPRVSVNVRSEREFYADQSRILRGLVSTLGIGIAVLMGAGAVFAALNTMYSAVAARTREIATLRALGFGAVPVVSSVLVEGLLLGLIGGLLGGVVAYFGFNGYQASTLNWASFSQITFAFTVTPALLTTGLMYALLLAFIGGLLPGIRAARLPVTAGLREL